MISLRRPTRAPRDLSIHAAIGRSFALLSAVIVAASAVSFGVAAVNLYVFQARVDDSTDAIRATREAHAALLDEETALRAWLATADPAFLDPYEGGARRIADHMSDATAQLVHLPRSAALVEHAIEFRVAQERWSEAWAEPALTLFGSDEALAGGEMYDRLADGRQLFDQYRLAQEAFLADLLDVREDARAHQRTATEALGLTTILLALTLLVSAARQRRRLTAMLRPPLDELDRVMARVAAGELDEHPDVDGPTELREISEGMSSMIDSLAAQRCELAEREESLRVLTARLEEILRMSREISGTGNPRYVAENAAAAAQRLSGARRALVWLVNDDRTLALAHDSALPHGMHPDAQHLDIGVGVAGAAVADARVAVGSDRAGHHRSAWPLVVGARVIGALELESDAPLDADAVDAVATLGVHAASALEAARLYSENAELARLDPLTRLANRRSFTEDLEREAERTLRYGGPLSLLMLDLDHFKRLNDTFGHPFGDEVLQRVAAALTAGIRQVDSAYRLGGEEFAVLARETDGDGAEQLAERLRVAVAGAFPSGDGDLGSVTISIGVAELGVDVHDTVGLVAAADGALYASKRDGRDRVTRAAAAVASA